MSLTKKEIFWYKVVGESWYNNCKELFNSCYMETLLKFITEEYKKGIVFPEKNNVFKAFKATPFNKVKVVILGQDPYFTDENGIPDATGLAFANPMSKLKSNPSLDKIHEVVEQSYNGLKIDFDVTLESWANQGVLLLNTALTVKKFSVTSHSKAWDKFTCNILKYLNLKTTGLHFCLWGSNAKKYKKYINPKLHFIYEAEHPAYAARQGKKWNCNHFFEINKNISEQNGSEFIIKF